MVLDEPTPEPRAVGPEDDTDPGPRTARTTDERIEVAVEKMARRITGEHEALTMRPTERRMIPPWMAVIVAIVGTLGGSIVTRQCAGWVEAPYALKSEVAAKADLAAATTEIEALKTTDATITGAMGQINLAIKALSDKIDERLPPKKGKNR